MNDNGTYEVEVRLWSERDLDALQDALKKTWENTGPGLYMKTGFAEKAKCIISNDGNYLSIHFIGKKETSSKPSEPRIPQYIHDNYMSAVNDLKQLLEQRKQEDEDLTTDLIP